MLDKKSSLLYIAIVSSVLDLSERNVDMLTSSTARTPRDRRNLRWVSIIQIVWLVCLIANGRTFQDLFTAPFRILLAWLPLAVGAVVFWAHVRFIRQADDLQKMIQLSALAIGFGVSAIFTLAYPPLERLGLPHLEPNHYTAIGVLTYFFATAFHSYRYE
jgi:hypothetical protein